jgi:hypothetical protein
MKKSLLISLAIVTCLFSGSSVVSAADNATSLTVDQLMAKAASLVGQTVTVKGTCKHVCATSGRKLFLAGEKGQLIRINAGKKIDKFDKTAIGKEVTATGVVVEHRTTMAMLDKQEAMAIEAEKKQAKPEHCSTEAKANGEDVKATPAQRIKTQKEKLAKQIADGGKNYFATYTVDGCDEYTIAK